MRKLIRIIAVILLIVGIGFFAYPIALRVVFNMQANQAIDQLEQLKTDEFQTDDSVTDECDLPYAQLRKAMFDYNERYMAWIKHYASKLAYLLWLTPSGQVAHVTLDRRLCRTRIFRECPPHEKSL